MDECPPRKHRVFVLKGGSGTEDSRHLWAGVAQTLRPWRDWGPAWHVPWESGLEVGILSRGGLSVNSGGKRLRRPLAENSPAMAEPPRSRIRTAQTRGSLVEAAPCVVEISPRVGNCCLAPRTLRCSNVHCRCDSAAAKFVMYSACT